MSGKSVPRPLIVRRLGCVEYRPVAEKMKAFTGERAPDTCDEAWILEHEPVYTSGIRSVKQPGKGASSIPVVKTNRGGEMTYHGPGQLIAYFLLNIRERNMGPRVLVEQLESLVIDVLSDYGLAAARRTGAPGVYVEGRKIASLGLHATASYCYHGLSINVRMDLAPFGHIDTCGVPALEMTQLSDHVDGASVADTADRLERCALERFAEQSA